jgi:cobalt/nickel transport system ATP-binding protein
MSQPALVLRNLTVRYEPAAPSVVTDVSLTVADGERVALLGLNGSGKTTMLMAMVGLLPHEGRIEVCGLEVTRRNLVQVRERIGFLFNVPEDQLLFPKVVDDVAFGLLRRGRPAGEASAKAMAVLDSLGIGHLAASSLHHLSHGQKQRVALAGALVTEPPLLLFDEPSAALDPPSRRGLLALLRRQPAAMVIATHDLDFAREICSRFIVLESGSVAYDGPDVSQASRRWHLDASP